MSKNLLKDTGALSSGHFTLQSLAVEALRNQLLWCDDTNLLHRSFREYFDDSKQIWVCLTLKRYQFSHTIKQTITQLQTASTNKRSLWLDEFYVFPRRRPWRWNDWLCDTDMSFLRPLMQMTPLQCKCIEMKDPMQTPQLRLMMVVMTSHHLVLNLEVARKKPNGTFSPLYTGDLDQ